jgi:O-antigen/teichoic acid export membrane protein
MSRDTASLSLGREALIGFVAKILLAGMGFAGIVVYYRFLGPETLGIYYTVLAAANVVAQFVGGFASALQKRVSERQTDLAEYIGVGVVVYVTIVGAGGVLAYALEPTISSVFLSSRHLWGGVGIFASLSLFTVTNRIYSGIGKPGLAVWTDAARSVLTLALQLGLLFVGLREFGLIYGYVAATLVSALGVLALIGVRPVLPSRRALARTWEFAKWSVPSGFANNLYGRIDVLILAVLVSSTAVGLYEPAHRLTVPATFVAASVGASLTVKASGLSSIGESVEHDLRNAVSYTLLLAAPLFFGALAMPEALMRTIYGPSATAGAMALVGLALFQVFNSFQLPFDNLVSGIDRPEINLGVSVVTISIDVVLAVVLARAYGLEGVVAATVLSEVVRVVIFQGILYRMFGSFVLTRPVIEQLASAVVMFLAVEGVLLAFSIRSVLDLLLVVSLGGAVYFGCLLVVSPHFRLTLDNVLGDFVPN